MRRLSGFAAGAAFAFLPLTAFAQDLTPDSTRYLSDPNFLPYTGQIYGYSAYGHTWTNGDTFNNLSDKTSSFRVNTDTLSQFLSYGITDDLEVNGAVRYDPDSQREIDYGNGTRATLNSSGFTDPSFGVVWRALDEGPSPVDFDLFGSYTPNLIDSNSSTINADGTVARGGASGTAGAALGYVTQQFSIRGAFNANIFGASSSFDPGNGDTYQTQGFNDYVVSLATQTRLDPLFSINAGIDHTFASNTNALNAANGIVHTTQPGDNTALHAALNYNLVPEQAVIAATYTHNFYDNSQSVFANPALDTSTRSKSGNVLGMQLSYLLP